MWLDEAVKSHFSEHPWAVNMLKHPKHFCNLQDRALSYFSNTPREMELENVSLSDISNFRTVC